jgi:general secretion pathway protein D
VLCLSCLPCLYAPGLQAQEAPAAINLNFVDTELEVFVEFVAKITNKRILYDSSLKGKKIFIVSPTPVGQDELYKILLSVIEYNGFILETTGTGNAELIKIKRNIQGPWTQTKTLYSESELKKIESQDEFITMVIKLKYISSREVQTTLRALRIVNPQGGNLAGIEGSNSILITDYAPNVKRIFDVIKLMDEDGPQKEFKLMRLKNAIADDVVEQLKEFVKPSQRNTAGGFGGGPDLEEIKIMADKRLNAVIVQAYAAKMQQIATLVEELDLKLKDDPSNIHYIRLKHADAGRLQETLTKLIESGGLAKKSATTPSTATPAASTGSQVELAIEAEPQTNSLIIRADEHQWKEIGRIIQEIDVRRPQIILEGALIEVSPDNRLSLGVEVFWAEAPEEDRASFSGGTNFGMSNLVVVDKNNNATPVKPGSTINNAKKFGKLPNPTSEGVLGAMNFNDIFTMPVLINALQSQGDFKILSQPRVLTNDNQQAQIKVTDQVGAQTTTESSGGSQVRSFSGYQEAGTTLNITPHISGEQNYLRLDIEQTIEEFDFSKQLTAEIPPPKSTRKIVTSVTVPDRHTVAIGGFTFDSQQETVKKIPLLGDIPFFGLLFQQRVVTHRKRNIYLFVTPHIFREDTFKDLLNFSHESKLDAQTYGVNIEAVDKSFNKYQHKYSIQNGGLEPVYMLNYQSPDQQKTSAAQDK